MTPSKICFILQPNQRINTRWTNEELLLAVQGVRKYGKNFKAISEVIANKTETHVRSFFVNYRRRFNLDEVLAEYEAEYGKIEDKDEDEKMDVDEKVEDGQKNGTSAPPSGNTTVPPGGVPPPLLRQAPGQTNPAHPVMPLRQPPPLHQQSSPR